MPKPESWVIWCTLLGNFLWLSAYFFVDRPISPIPLVASTFFLIHFQFWSEDK